MSVAEVIQQRNNLKFLDYVRGILANKGMSEKEFLDNVYGVYSRPSHVLNVMKGKQATADKTLHRWAPILGVPFETLKEKRGSITQPRRGIPQHKLALGLSQPTVAPVKETSLPVEAISETLIFTLDNKGRATIRLTLTDVPMPVAMRFVEALNNSGLFNPEPVTPKESEAPWQPPILLEP